MNSENPQGHGSIGKLLKLYHADSQQFYATLETYDPESALKLTTALALAPLIDTFCTTEHIGPRLSQKNFPAEDIFYNDVYKSAVYTLSRYCEKLWQRSWSDANPEHLLITTLANAAKLDRGTKLHVERYLAGGTSTSIRYMTSALQAIHVALVRDHDTRPDAEIVSNIARNSYPFIRQFATMPSEDFDIAKHIHEDGRLSSLLNPEFFHIAQNNRQWSLHVNQNRIDEIKNITGTWITNSYTDPIHTGCPALLTGSVKQLWNWFIQEIPEMYERIT